jgi:xylulose-5-phosphate/fructose-6-phosphate phosphoketolase
MKTDSLTPELLHKMNAYWRAANYLSVGQIYLMQEQADRAPALHQSARPRFAGNPQLEVGRAPHGCAHPAT